VQNAQKFSTTPVEKLKTPPKKLKTFQQCPWQKLEKCWKVENFVENRECSTVARNFCAMCTKTFHKVENFCAKWRKFSPN
jgi:hypothetical protein